MKAQSGKLDYLIIGHITHDLLGDHFVLGGTVTYAGLCARNLGHRTAILTSCTSDLEAPDLYDIQIEILPSRTITTFENIETSGGRMQMLHAVANTITRADVPNAFENAKIVHLGPVADEIDNDVISKFPDAFLGITPQGWMRRRNSHNEVQYKDWEHADSLLPRADAVVLSIEDVRGDRNLIEEYASKTKILAVTDGSQGAEIYWRGDVRHFSAPQVEATDPTGAGDIFAAVFFSSLAYSNDPWIAGKKAVSIATDSVRRVGIKGVPTAKQMQALQQEIVEDKN